MKELPITKDEIKKLRNTLWYTNTWYYKIAKKDILDAYDILEKMIDAYEELQKRNKILGEVSITLIKN